MKIKGSNKCKARRTISAAAAESLQSCSTLCDPIDGSPPGSPNLGILQARTLEWAAISFSSEQYRAHGKYLINCFTIALSLINITHHLLVLMLDQ